jgi:hypothetical protein
LKEGWEEVIFKNTFCSFYRQIYRNIKVQIKIIQKVNLGFLQSGFVKKNGSFRIILFQPERKPAIIINKELSHTILGVDLRKLPWSLILIFKIKKEQIEKPLISDYLCF